MSEHLSLEQLSALLEEPQGTPDRVLHVEGCEECQKHLALLRELDRSLAVLPTVKAPAEEWSHVLASLRPEPAAAKRKLDWRGRLRTGLLVNWGVPQFAMAAALVLVVFGGGLLTGLWVDGRPPAELAGYESAIRALSELETLRLKAAVPVGEVSPSEPSAVKELVTLDALAEATREAIRKDPVSPFINRYLFAVEGLREALALELQGKSLPDVDPEVRAAIHDSVMEIARTNLALLKPLESKQIMIGADSSLAGVDPGGVSLAGLLGRSNAFAGVWLESLTPELAELFPGLDKGLLVLRVLPETPAEELGLRPGDVVVEVSGVQVRNLEELYAVASESLRNRRSLVLAWYRGGERLSGTLPIL